MPADPFSNTGRVFVLGSGFSASFGLPTLRTLFPTLMSPAADEMDRMRVVKALDNLYPHFHWDPQRPPSYPPFEEFLGLVMASEETPPGDPHWWVKARKSALHLLCDCLWSLTTASETSEASTLLQQFVIGLRPHDVVITFNWDTLLERELRRQGKPLVFTGHKPDAITVLKLHGSLGWVTLPEGSAPSGGNPLVPLVPEHHVYHHPEHAYTDPWLPLDAPPLIVPPVAAKRPAAEGFLSALWKDASRGLWHAQHIVVIGYSAPPEDLQARSLLTAMFALRSLSNPGDGGRYVVVDPDSAVAARYYSQIGPKLEFHQTFFCSDILEDLF